MTLQWNISGHCPLSAFVQTLFSNNNLIFLLMIWNLIDGGLGFLFRAFFVWELGDQCKVLSSLGPGVYLSSLLSWCGPGALGVLSLWCFSCIFHGIALGLFCPRSCLGFLGALAVFSPAVTLLPSLGFTPPIKEWSDLLGTDGAPFVVLNASY